MTTKRTIIPALLAAVMVMGPFVQTGAAQSPSGDAQILFFPTPQPDSKKPWLVRNFGPVGIGINLVKPGLTMQIHNVEPGSPADQTGQLKKGQIIDRINGQDLAGGRDAREVLGDMITQAEATDGLINLTIRDMGNVQVKIPVMGGYEKNWPLNCSKSDTIVRNLAAVLAKQDKPRWGSVLFLLSTGEDSDLDIVKKWMRSFETLGTYQWHIGYHGIGVCEYYLRTGDERMLPIIEEAAGELKKSIYNGGWSGRGQPASFTYSTGTGQMHAAGVHCLTFLLLARMCGVEVDDEMLQSALKQFYRFAGHGNVAYGDGLPEGGFRDNGKTGGLAVAMAAAARLTPEGESSVYAKTRDNSAMKSFYATNWFHAAHTGGGIGEIWHHAAMGLMHDKRQLQYRSYLDTRRWVMDLSRRWDGSIGIAGMDDRYDRSATEQERSWGTLFALTYTLPRKHLQLFGAPPTKWCKTYQLPTRPWGTPADDMFQLPTPVEAPGAISMRQILQELVPTDSSQPLMDRINAKAKDQNGGIPLEYLAHPDYGIRSATMRALVNSQRYDMVLPLLRSSDPRYRDNGLLAIAGMFKGRGMPASEITREMFDAVGMILENPNESWWVLQNAANALARADKSVIAKHHQRLLELLDYDSTWVKTAAVKALGPLIADPQHYQNVLPKVVNVSASFWNDAASGTCTHILAQEMNAASPEVKAFAFPILKEAYKNVPSSFIGMGGARQPNATQVIRTRIGNIMEGLPGGMDFIKQLPKRTTAYARSGDDQDLYQYSGEFTPNPQLVGTWAWAIWPRPKSPEELPAAAEKWVKSAQKQIEEYNNLPDSQKRGRNRKTLWKDTLEIKDGGLVKSTNYFKGYFWSGDMLIGINSDVARKMGIRNFGGKDFLIIESGGFDHDDMATDWNSRYTIYMRID
ncbi:MAG: DUF6288 domain-containing protein [Lentisphaeria bacterium]|nr:DUF6288 domain-containing protein [Lentisphaeria bacterium]